MSDSSTYLNDRNWLPHRLDVVSDRVQFIHLPDEARKQLTFMASFQLETPDQAVWIPGEDIRNFKPDSVPSHYIFHTAFCRSTLLVRAMDELPGCAGYSEPQIFNDIAVSLSHQNTQSLLQPIFNLFARSGGDLNMTVVKPSNHANQVLPLIMQHMPKTKAIMMTSGLGAFLRSVAKKGMEGRIWARRLNQEISSYAALDLGLSDDEKMRLTDMQVTALTWLLHQRHFAMILRTPFRGRFRTLDSALFNDRKSDSFRALASHFDFAFDDNQIDELIGGPVFSSHAKQGGDYEETMADQAKKAASPIIEEEIGYVEKWGEHIAGQLDLEIPISQPLF
ncbi:hypothetical protein SAMN02745824_3322 [Parasphingorhabdus marina DSM 22363]|uniref:Uncharacterized protein n=1 Tax=Parasphingorhabdus marina DSM 22363 TaxID=1123272 RepID=A0A1N6HJQ6_9SPHN|nr:hypothetical protein [Parasphingorhabdus marina]SIO20000.1 hypothetical protein SAMN02745824_3322 [Parasphingorhabdus marina DSM 22363]